MNLTMRVEELYLDNNLEHYNTVSLKNIYIQHKENIGMLFKYRENVFGPIEIHCNLINSDYNYVNDKKSDVITKIKDSH